MNEIEEIAKAVQESAKTAKAGIELTESVGRFLAWLTKEPLEIMRDIASEKLRLMQERLRRFQLREFELLSERNIRNVRTVPAKLALPIVENASLEEVDELQDLWAHLLASALDLNFKGEVRSAFIDIIKQLNVADVHVLESMYEELTSPSENNREPFADHFRRNLTTPKRMIDRLGIALEAYENSLDNLLRLRLVSSNVDFVRTSSSDSYAEGRGDLLNHRDYDLVCLTSLGVTFIETCTKKSSR